MAVGDAAFSTADIMRRLNRAEADIRELRGGHRLESSTIGEGGLRVKGEGGITLQNGGGMTVEDGGDIDVIEGGNVFVRGGGDVRVEGGGDLEVTDGGEFRAIHPSGHPLLSIFRHSDGKYRIYMRRDDGSVVMQILTHSNGEQFWALWDREERILVSDDAQSGKGLARPWLPVVLYKRFINASGPTGYATIDAADIGTEDTLWEGRASISHPTIAVDGLWGQASGSNTSSYRLEVNFETVGTWNETGLVVERQEFDVSAQVGADNAPVKLFASASGTGLVACQVLGCYLRQS